jgi:beta-glucosidase/6-phospho-beta-glucosidase/beta-galactosidase
MAITLLLLLLGAVLLSAQDQTDLLPSWNDGAARKAIVEFVRVTTEKKAVRFEAGPGLNLRPGALNQVRHHAVLGHGLAVDAVRAKGQKGTKVGPAENIVTAVPLIEPPDHVKAARAAAREPNASYRTVMHDGK